MSRPGGALLAVVALALVLRLGLVAADRAFVPVYDAADYQRIAVSIAEAGGYPPTTYASPGTPSAFRPPAWPFALAATKAVAGPGWTAGRLLGACLGAAAVLLLALIARELWGRSVALLAGGLAAVFPPLLFADTALLSEALFTPCMLGMTWLLLVAGRRAHPLRWIAAAGALAGLAILTRSSGAVLVPALAAGAWAAVAAGGSRRTSLAAAALAVGVAGATLVPWTVRNAAAFEALVPVSTQSGYTLAGTYNAVAAEPGRYEAAGRIPADVPALRPIFAEPGHDEADLDRRLGAAARAYVAEHPGYVGTVLVRNTQRLWTLGGREQRWLTRLSHSEMGVPARLDGLLSLSAVLALLAGVAGAVVLRRGRGQAARPRGPRWLWAMPALLWLSTVAVSGGPRYRVVIDPFLLLLAAVAVASAVSARRRASTRRRHGAPAAGWAPAARRPRRPR